MLLLMGSNKALPLPSPNPHAAELGWISEMKAQ